ncbi:phosphopantetheine-binding protein [Dactylosporangium sp. CS-033363]|uniref:phosphopantetheine-binding protein n=1 Tax=Dactylosporangium sp. CS-033363 TaxID=3239935 RepID=UPI003D90DCC8
MSTAEESVRDVVRKLVEDQLNVGGRALDPDDDLWNLGMTSLTCMGLMLNLEDALDVELPTELLQHETFRSVNTIVAAIDGAREDTLA